MRKHGLENRCGCGKTLERGFNTFCRACCDLPRDEYGVPSRIPQHMLQLIANAMEITVFWSNGWVASCRDGQENLILNSLNGAFPIDMNDLFGAQDFEVVAVLKANFPGAEIWLGCDI